MRSAVARPAGREDLVDGELRLDVLGHRVWLDGAEVAVTVREFALLAYLMANPGVVLTRERLMRVVWQCDHGDHGTVTVHVRRLRAKIEKTPSKPRRIVTVRGVGYRYEAGSALVQRRPAACQHNAAE